MTQQPKVTKREPLDPAEAKWTRLVKLNWTDQTGKSRVWEAAERSTRGEGGIDAVAILAIVPVNNEKHVLCQKQFRPPVGKYCVEIPAGLIDGRETPEEAAVRELREETGYVGTVQRSSVVMVNDPGLTNANLKVVVMNVDMDLPANQHPVQQLDEGEFITNFTLPLRTLAEELERLEREGFVIDVRLAVLAMGLKMSV
ncbi:ADP-ribose diphosphatase [Schizosaccharomyces japonicus yFS275]|uniref:ADP-ribose diphosphatase n=1 Tax=Schizosaccharomyces japonicus (strain yFS275 / FY16936) TaxID=402676 RepID=B6K5K3_SCHJY|nr:ADP-ribose diphosphatase [Schizosaccharomyces japonicus yFS275]EEB08807.1 ADP-ribose diphosphatase [Schizosaccharomyces japonicus yFS275]